MGRPLTNRTPDQPSLALFGHSEADQLAEALEALYQTWLASAPSRGPGGGSAGAPEAGRATGKGRLRSESAAIYGDMWHAFVGFCVPLDRHSGVRSIRFDPRERLERADLEVFLATAGTGSGRKPATRSADGELSLRYAWRMLHLIDRVLNFSRGLAGLQSLDAARELMQDEPYRYANAATLTPAAETLTDDEARRLIAHLTQQQSVELPQELSWKDVRDRTAAALMLGAGLAPGQVRALRLEDVTTTGGRLEGVPWRLTVLADGSCIEHQAPLADWAGRQLAFWLKVRASMDMAGIHVFVSTAAGKPWSHPACHRAMVTLLDTVGIEGGTPFRLRHTFAVRQLANGHSDEEVARWMGYVDTAPLRRYKHLVTRPPIGMA